MTNATATNNPANTIDTSPDHQHYDSKKRHWYRHMNGTIYCEGSKVLSRLDFSTLQATAADCETIEIASMLYAKWNSVPRF